MRCGWGNFVGGVEEKDFVRILLFRVINGHSLLLNLHNKLSNPLTPEGQSSNILQRPNPKH